MKWDSIKKAWDHGLITHRLQQRLGKIGLNVDVFYLVSEGDYTCSPEWLAKFQGYEVRTLTSQDMEQFVIKRPWEDLTKLKERLERGDICIGIQYEDEVVASTWVDLKRCNHAPILFDVADNEAYLYDARTLDEFRGKGLAPFMRYQCYEYLRRLGRDHYYSYSDYFNKSSINFKKKLNARFEKLYISFSIGSGKSHTFLLRDF
jgi:hypothetical protein